MKKRCFLILALLLLPTLLLHGCKDKKKEGKTTPHPVEYESMLFDTSIVHKVDVDIAEEDWADLLENPTDKTKYHADITIDGEKVKDVSFATKGNSSLIFVAADPDSDRYSYKVSFGQYVAIVGCRCSGGANPRNDFRRLLHHVCSHRCDRRRYCGSFLKYLRSVRSVRSGYLVQSLSGASHRSTIFASKRGRTCE